MVPRVYWIAGPWPGRLGIAARPRGGDWLEDEISGWRRSGIDLIVSLLEPDEEKELLLSGEGHLARAQGLRFLSLPIPDRGIPASKEAATNLLSEIRSALEQGQGVAIHCRQGIGRSSLIAAGALVAAGVPPETAIEIISAARGLPVPETPEQLAWIARARSELAAPRL